MSDDRVRLKRSLGPFWRWTLNFMTGCNQCVYCYNRRWKWVDSPRLKTDLSLLERQARDFEWAPGPSAMCTTQYDIMMSSSHDPFYVNRFSAFSTSVPRDCCAVCRWFRDPDEEGMGLCVHPKNRHMVTRMRHASDEPCEHYRRSKRSGK